MNQVFCHNFNGHHNFFYGMAMAMAVHYNAFDWIADKKKSIK